MELIMDNCLRGHGDEVLDFINESQNKPMDKRTEADEIILNELT